MNSEQKAQFEKKLIAIEIELGFLRVPANGKDYMPSESRNIGVFWDDRHAQVKWNVRHQRIYCLTSFFG